MKVRNVPSAEGRMIGDNLARWADNAEGKWRKEKGFFPVRCASCAFKKGSFPNGCLSTAADATKCLMENVPFLCHHGLKGNGPLSVCAGWLMMAGGKRVEAPWPWSEDIRTDETSEAAVE